MKRALAAGLLVLSLSACGAGTARGDIAAKVGSRTISVDELADLVDAGLRDREWAAQTGDNRAEYQRQVLDRMLRHAIFEEVAQRLGVMIADAELRQHREQLEQGSLQQNRVPFADAAANSGLSPADLDTWVRTSLLEAKLRDKLVPEPLTAEQVRQFDAAEVEHILVADARRANEILGQLRAGADFAALARRFTIDQPTKDTGGKLPQVGRGQLDPALDRAIFDGPLNALQGPIRTRFGFEVLRVTQRRIVKPADVPDEVRRQIQEQISTGRLREQVDKVVGEVGVDVNPRFGAWEGIELVGAPDDLSSPPTTPPAAPGGGIAPGDPNQQPPQGDPNQPPPGDPNQPPPTAPPGG